MTEPQPDRQRRKLYGRRKGPKLSAHQTELRRTLLSEIVFDQIRDALAQFPDSVRELWLEVGFGAGEHLFQLAGENPDVGLIGAEPYESGVAKLLTKLANNPLNNVRIYEGDGRDIIMALPDASLARFFLLFPDPWPKTRHHKRRFLQMEMLDELARVLKPGAELRFATDDKSYLPYALERLAAHPAFEWTARGASDWKRRPEGWPPTRYEAKAIKGPPSYLAWRRRTPDPARSGPGPSGRTANS
ncbi:MAG TPA: tRNA (guanosine(46)-N7)-methyltransferase TrmB [Rhizomicrobium sp.]|jgi:tRNA (guanine-N7-)-methyltransferase